MKRLFVTGIVAVAFVGCSSPARNVIPLADGQYQVDGVARSSDRALQLALRAATITCKKQSKRHVVTSQKTAYKGMVSEDTNRAIDKAASAVAGATGTYVPTLSNDDDYRITLTFRCE